MDREVGAIEELLLKWLDKYGLEYSKFHLYEIWLEKFGKTDLIEKYMIAWLKKYKNKQGAKRLEDLLNN
jgi:hypothetical protein